MPQFTRTITKKGTVNLQGITLQSKSTAEELLLKDAESYHCLTNELGYHNHLSHHILASYDIGTPAQALKKIYEGGIKGLRPKYLEERDKSIVVDKSNWFQYLANISAYGAFIDFFKAEIGSMGVPETIEKYVFSDEGNKDGRKMFIRFLAAAFHPFIQTAYGLEFGMDELVATGLAQAAMHRPLSQEFMEGVNTGPAQGEGKSLLEVLRQTYESTILKPAPYDANKDFRDIVTDVMAAGGVEEITRLVSLYHITNTPTALEVTKSIEEIIWVVTLLLFGCGKRGRKPRLDFFMMHLVTSSIFLKHLCEAVKTPEYQARMIRGFIVDILVFTVAAGRPRIDAEMVMALNPVPRPPVGLTVNERIGKTALGDPNDDGDYNPWHILVDAVQYYPEAHAIKTMRTLLYAAREFGTTAPGGVPGAFRDSHSAEAKSKVGVNRTGGVNGKSAVNGTSKEETHAGIGKVDGTLFVRCAGVLLDTMGWVRYGQEGGFWDRSGLGWDEAWNNGDFTERWF